MKRNVLRILPILFLFFTATAFAPAPESAEVRIDGKLIQPEKKLEFPRDDTVYLEAIGIKPNSMINIKVKKAGISWVKHEFEVDETGEVKGIMHMPEQKLKVTCFVNYYSADGTFHEVKFKFRTV
ncbi:MAG: hypothetical protein AAGN35_20620 [Bacteroidota bacterium]